MKATTRRKPGLDLTVKNYKGDFIEIKLSTGKAIKLRQMIGKDFLFIEENLADMGDTKRSFKLIERLSVEPDNITFIEILELEAGDIELLSKGLAEANGITSEEDELED